MKKTKKRLAAFFMAFLMMAVFIVPMQAVGDISIENNIGNIAVVYADIIEEAKQVLYSFYVNDEEFGNRQLIINTVEYIFGLSGEKEFLLATFVDAGYAIIDLSTGRLAEGSVFAPSPFLHTNGDRFFAGPLNYAIMQRGEMFTTDGQHIPQESIEMMIEELATLETNRLMESYELNLTPFNFPSSRDIAQWNYVRNMLGVPRSGGASMHNDGTCGSVGAAMMLAYFQDILLRPRLVLPIHYWSQFGTDNQTLHNELTRFVEMGWPVNGSTPGSISRGINDWMSVYVSARPNPISASSSYFNLPTRVAENINNNRPVLLTYLDFKYPVGSKGGHVVMAYGYSGGVSSNMFVRIHCGWRSRPSDNDVIFPLSGANGVVWIDIFN